MRHFVIRDTMSETKSVALTLSETKSEALTMSEAKSEALTNVKDTHHTIVRDTKVRNAYQIQTLTDVRDTHQHLHQHQDIHYC